MSIFIPSSPNSAASSLWVLIYLDISWHLTCSIFIYQVQVFTFVPVPLFSFIFSVLCLLPISIKSCLFNRELPFYYSQSLNEKKHKVLWTWHHNCSLNIYYYFYDCLGYGYELPPHLEPLGLAHFILQNNNLWFLIIFTLIYLWNFLIFSM